MSIRIAYQGFPGSYSEAAIGRLKEVGLIPSVQDIQPVPCESFEDAFVAVTRHEADRALLPIQNSLGGSIHANYDLLIRFDLKIVGEVHFRVHHALMALPGTRKKDIRVVMSHPQALAQCDEYIRAMGVERSPQGDTAGSARMISKQKLKNAAAIASEHAASIYGLEILETQIEDEHNNYTRFLLLSRENIASSVNVPSLTSLVFALKSNVPGALFKALSVFALRDIDLSKIESRPAKGLRLYLEQPVNSSLEQIPDKPGPEYEHFFYVDIVAHVETTAVQNAIRHLEEIAPVTRILGVYPRDLTLSWNKHDHRKSSKPLITQPSVSPCLKIFIVGFGNFGQFIAKTFVKKGHVVYGWNRTDKSSEASKLGVHFLSSLEDALQLSESFDVVILSTSILSFESIFSKLSFENTSFSNCLLVDVLSVKALPKEVFSKYAPSSIDVLLTHPMFGPESGKDGWQNLPMVYEEFRITNYQRCSDFLSIFADEGCELIRLSAESHDAYAASSQFITHLTGRVLASLGPASTPINTKGFEMLLQLVDSTRKDSWDLFYALFKHNSRSLEQLDAFEKAFLDVKSKLISGNENIQNPPELLEEIPINPRVKESKESATAAIFDRASQLKRAGKPVISLCVGEPDFPIPTPIKEAIIQGVENNNTRYTPTAGLFELREAIAAKLLRDNGLVYSPEQIVVSNGAKQSIMQAMTVLLQPGDSVLIPAPYWPSYRDMAILNGAVPVEIPTQIKHQYKLTPDLLHGYLSSATKAKILLLCSPSNPTGSVYSRSELKALVSVISEFPQLFILSDEIYEYLLYEGEHVSIASFPEISARCIVINGFSKSFCMTGLRIGFAAAPLRISTELIKVQSHLTSCAGSLSQVAALAALRLQRESLSPMLQQFKERRDLVCNRLMELGNCVEFFTPQGAFYVFVDVSRVLRANPAGIQSDTELCLFLLENHCIALVPGSGFGCPGALRISYSISKMQLETAMDAFVKGIQTISSTP